MQITASHQCAPGAQPPTLTTTSVPCGPPVSSPRGQVAETPSRRASSLQLAVSAPHLLPAPVGTLPWPPAHSCLLVSSPPTAPPARGSGRCLPLTWLPGARRPLLPGLDKEQAPAHRALGHLCSTSTGHERRAGWGCLLQEPRHLRAAGHCQDPAPAWMSSTPGPNRRVERPAGRQDAVRRGQAGGAPAGRGSVSQGPAGLLGAWFNCTEGPLSDRVQPGPFCPQ